MPTLPGRQRFALVCFVASLGLLGVIGYASEEDTIAGDPAKIELESGCPAGFLLQEWNPGEVPDDNGNGFVCANKLETIDDLVEDEGHGKIMAAGHGNFFDEGKVKFLQDLSFSFHGLRSLGGGEATGQFEYHDQTPDGADLTVHGVVHCLIVTGNQATLVGQVTRSNDKQLFEGEFVTWIAVDNGEGSGDPPDQISRPMAAGKLGCKKMVKEKEKAPEEPGNGALLEVVSGNIQIAHASDDETLADDPSKIEGDERCPDGYFLTPWKLIGEPPDKNGNGYVCVGKTDTIDDIIEDPDHGKIIALGHGNFFDKPEFSKESQDISFSFNGLKTFGKGEASGQFEYHKQSSLGADVTVHGEVRCLLVNGGIATLSGEVTRSTDKFLSVGTWVSWMAADLGEGIGDPPDEVSSLFGEGFKKGSCSSPKKEKEIGGGTLRQILSGNIQIN